MRKLFAGYYRPTDEEFKKLWDECIFTFDANVLLDLYRFTTSTLNHLLDIMEGLAPRIWITHQAALEYHRNRLTVVNKQMEPYDLAVKNLTECCGSLQSILEKHKRDQVKDVPAQIRKVQSACESAQTALQEMKNAYPDLLNENYPPRDRLARLFDGKVGKPFGDSDLESRYRLAVSRAEQQIPPGYLDKGKDGAKKYGDTILWFQLIEHAKAASKPIILVTDENKDDWWLKNRGETIGPRPELIQEMHAEAKVQFHMYDTVEFMRRAETFLHLQHQKKAAQEAKDVARQVEQQRGLQSPFAGESAVALGDTLLEQRRRMLATFAGESAVALGDTLLEQRRRVLATFAGESAVALGDTLLEQRRRMLATFANPVLRGQSEKLPRARPAEPDSGGESECANDETTDSDSAGDHDEDLGEAGPTDA